MVTGRGGVGAVRPWHHLNPAEARHSLSGRLFGGRSDGGHTSFSYRREPPPCQHGEGGGVKRRLPPHLQPLLFLLLPSPGVPSLPSLPTPPPVPLPPPRERWFVFYSRHCLVLCSPVIRHNGSVFLGRRMHILSTFVFHGPTFEGRKPQQ